MTKAQAIEMILGYECPYINEDFDKELKENCNPANTYSSRQKFYIQIEQMMIQSELTSEKLAAVDPRGLVMLIMEQLRECSKTIVSPQHFQIAMLRVGCLVIASLQWMEAWIEKMVIAKQQNEEGRISLLPSFNGSLSNKEKIDEHMQDNEEEYRKAQEENE